MMVGKNGINNWRIINPAEEGSTWECHSSGDFCKSNLKPGAMPNLDANSDITGCFQASLQCYGNKSLCNSVPNLKLSTLLETDYTDPIDTSSDENLR